MNGIGYRLLILLFVLLMGSGELAAQGWGLDVNFIIGNPRDEFQDNIDAVGFGGSVAGGYHFGESPFMIGADLAYMIYGHETRTEPFSTTIPDVTVDVVTSNNIFQGHLLFRLQSKQGGFRPYLDGLLGFNYLFTETEIKDEDNFFNDNSIASSTNQEDGTFSYGAGGGVMIRVAEIDTKNTDSKLKEVLINFQVRYIFGGEAEYLKEGSIRREGGNVIYDLSNSRTNLLTFKVGVVFGF